MSTTSSQNPSAKPPWLKVRFPGGKTFNWIEKQAESLKLATVCQEARCPNIGECWSGGTATFMLMGDTCTRGCRFCAVDTAKMPGSLDPEEPLKLAETIAQMKLEYVVITSVNRDDLLDQGSQHLARAIRTVKRSNLNLLIEILIPDFKGNVSLVQTIMDSQPAVISHNLETVRRLTPKVRDPRATYDQSLAVLDYIRTQSSIYTKSSLMLGLGESEDEIIESMKDLRSIGVQFLTLGQYLRPSPKHLPVERYVHPSEFEAYQKLGESLGFEYVASGPLVRSSYRAAEFYIQRKIQSKA